MVFIWLTDSHVIVRFFRKPMHHTVIGPHNFIGPVGLSIAKVVLSFVGRFVGKRPVVVVGAHGHNVVLAVNRRSAHALVVVELRGLDRVVRTVLAHQWHIGHHVWK